MDEPSPTENWRRDFPISASIPISALTACRVEYCKTFRNRLEKTHPVQRDEGWTWLPYLNRLPVYMPNEPFRWLGAKAATEYYRMTEFK